ncbi:MAG: YifB family Mg chelatase-like AAA ATPase [Actinomycetales bacterium]|nr:YifB family Mg chelatase-like AAA ATPase [Actinomycetales bacterium]
MGLGRTRAVALVGLTGFVVEVEAYLAASVPGFTLVGLPDASLSESRDRVRAALTSSGLSLPPRKITVNLSPASLPKTGAGYDLAIAVALLAGAGTLERSPEGVVHLGELGLDGRLRPVHGVLPAVKAGVEAGFERFLVPSANVEEARLVPGATVRGADSLAQVAYLYGADIPEPPEVEPVPLVVRGFERTAPGDLEDVVGQAEAREALEVAAAGGHHLYLVGPPGTGKTMLASRLPSILPDLGERAAVEVTAVHSLAGSFDPAEGLLRRPPFEDPHHTATAAAVVGGGSGVPRPGAASRAHRGVLFLDEAPEFAPKVLETLRQPLEHGELVLHRAAGTARYPARFQLVLAANPCPCGLASGRGEGCTCPPSRVLRYRTKLSGPLMDRVDLQIEVGPVSRAELAVSTPPETSAAVAARVLAAREVAAERYAGTGWSTNAEVPGRWLRDALRGERGVLAPLELATSRNVLTMRGADRVLRVAWTLADLDGRPAPGAHDVGRAMAMRSPEVAR